MACDGAACSDGATAAAATSSGGGEGGQGGTGSAGGDGSGGNIPPACLSCVDRNVMQVGELPCDVELILKSKCQSCHGDPLNKGAPFPLVSYADTQVIYFDMVMYARMHQAIKTEFMPILPPKLKEEETDTMLAWLCACAPPAGPDEACP